MAEKVKVAIVYEIIGRPKEHIEETIKKLVEVIGQEKGLSLIKKTFHDAKAIEHKDKEGKIIIVPVDQQLYSTFAEVEIEAEDIFKVILLCFKFMPAHIEIIEPYDFKISNYEFGSILNEVITKLHQYDTIAKSAIMNNQLLVNKLRELQGNSQVASVPKPIEEKVKKKPKEKSKKKKI